MADFQNTVGDPSEQLSCDGPKCVQTEVHGLPIEHAVYLLKQSIHTIETRNRDLNHTNQALRDNLLAYVNEAQRLVTDNQNLHDRVRELEQLVGELHLELSAYETTPMRI